MLQRDIALICSLGAARNPGPILILAQHGTRDQL